jgi:hypothetical protein
VLYSWRYAAPSTINPLYLAQQIFRLFPQYSVQSGNSAVGLNSYWISQMSSNTVWAIVNFNDRNRDLGQNPTVGTVRPFR